MFTIQVKHSISLEDASRRFLDSLQSWVSESIKKYDSIPIVDDPEQSVLLTAWEPYIHTMKDKEALDFVTRQRDRFRQHYLDTGQWYHGYWAYPEDFSGLEHFNRFLGMLTRLNPQDPFTHGQILDASEHLGNWVESIPAWFDWGRGLFYSAVLGTKRIARLEGSEVNTPDHLRLAGLALLAYRVSNRHRYLDLAAACAKPWCEAILRQVTLPLALLPGKAEDEYIPLYQADPAQITRYQSYLGDPCEDDSQPIARAERFLAADAVNLLIRLWRYLGENEFLLAAERLLDILIGALDDPDAGAVADAVRSYWRTTGSKRYNLAIITAMKKQKPQSIDEVAFEEAASRLKVRPVGVGKVVDMLTWLENGEQRRCNPILLATSAEITEDMSLAIDAMDLGLAYFKLAREALLDGRRKNSSSRTVIAVTLGNRRENHAGVISAVFKPLIETFFPDPADLLKGQVK